MICQTCSRDAGRHPQLIGTEPPAYRCDDCSDRAAIFAYVNDRPAVDHRTNVKRAVRLLQRRTGWRQTGRYDFTGPSGQRVRVTPITATTILELLALPE